MYKKFTLSILISSVISNLLVMTGPIYMLQVYDRVLTSSSISTLFALSALMIFLYLGLGCFDWLRTAFLTRISIEKSEALEEKVIPIIQELAIRNTKGFTNLYLDDLSKIQKFNSSLIIQSLYDAPFSILYLGLLYMMHWSFGIVAIIGAVVITLLALCNSFLNNQYVLNSREQGTRSRLYSNEIIRNNEVIKALGMSNTCLAHRRKLKRNEYVNSVFLADRLNVFSNLTKIFRLTLQSVILGTGAFFTIQGELSPGLMIAASVLISRTLLPVEQCVSRWREIVEVRESHKRIEQLLENTPPLISKMSLPSPEGYLNVEGLYIASFNEGNPLVKNLYFELTPGDILGVIGKSGKGKSTLLKTIVGILNPMSGNIILDRANLKLWESNELGKNIGYLPQDVGLMSGTVQDNISRFSLEKNSEKIVKAAKSANAHEMILSLKHGYDTEVGDSGSYLSSGQRQRIGLARALYDDPVLIVLDEPNSNLDLDGEKALEKSLKEASLRGAVIIFVSHRTSLLNTANLILNVEENRVKKIRFRESRESNRSPSRKDKILQMYSDKLGSGSDSRC